MNRIEPVLITLVFIFSFVLINGCIEESVTSENPDPELTITNFVEKLMSSNYSQAISMLITGLYKLSIES